MAGATEIILHSAANSHGVTRNDNIESTSNSTTVNNSSVQNKPAIVPARPRAAPGSRPGKNHTPRGKKEVIDQNKAKNGGKTICEGCGVETTKPEKSQKGLTPPSTDTQIDHIDPKANGGSGTSDNGQVLCRGCNIEKSDKVPTPPQKPSN